MNVRQPLVLLGIEIPSEFSRRLLGSQTLVIRHRGIAFEPECANQDL
jgi:hypothetical protein